jgi:hypothetical protein
MSEALKQRKKAAAQERLVAALRDNLKRRKAQTRGRQVEAKQETKEQAKHEAPAKPHDSAGIDAEK